MEIMEKKNIAKASEMRMNIIKIEDGWEYYSDGTRKKIEKEKSTDIKSNTLDK